MEEEDYDNAYFVALSKRKTEPPQPNVRNEDLIRHYIRVFNHENKIFGMDDLPPHELKELRLSYQNILKIQNLEGLRSLTKLCLDNNIISKIDGLSELANLEWLDLSFNKIQVLEGLEDLTNLTDLSLFSNQISMVNGGLESCTRLNVLSLGDNLIATMEPTITYLRGFANLQVLKLEGNKICDELNYKSYVIAHISQLKYLDYVLLDPEDIVKAKDEHRDDLNAKELNAQSQEELEKEMAEKKRIAELREAHLQSTYDAIESVRRENEDDESKIKVLPGQIDLFIEFAERVRETTQKFQEDTIEKNEIRQQLLSKFRRGVDSSERLTESEAIGLIKQFERKEKNALRIYEEDDERGEAELEQLLPEVDVLENELIEKELALVERLTEAINRFEKSLKNIVEGIKDLAKNFQESVNHEVDAYFGEIEKIKDEQIKAFYAENANMDNFTQEEKEVYQERDLLNNAINTLAEEYKNKTFEIEEEITKGYEKDMNDFIEEFKTTQLERNRTQLKEIMDLAQDKRQSIRDKIEE